MPRRAKATTRRKLRRIKENFPSIQRSFKQFETTLEPILKLLEIPSETHTDFEKALTTLDFEITQLQKKIQKGIDSYLYGM